MPIFHANIKNPFEASTSPWNNTTTPYLSDWNRNQLTLARSFETWISCSKWKAHCHFAAFSQALMTSLVFRVVSSQCWARQPTKNDWYLLILSYTGWRKKGLWGVSVNLEFGCKHIYICTYKTQIFFKYLLYTNTDIYIYVYMHIH